MWFETLTGFTEDNHEQVQANIEINGKHLISKVNGARYQFGTLETPTLAALRQSSECSRKESTAIRVSEVVGNIQDFHSVPSNHGALFQAASQFNLLEMINPDITPEQGIGIYEYDRTQGPACAISCGAGSIYRNYFVDVNGRIGQTKDNQIDCLFDIGQKFGNAHGRLWQMSNGYALPSSEGLREVNQLIENLTTEDYDQLKSLLRVGIQWDTQVTIHQSNNVVNQVYCSALPVSYSFFSQRDWEPFARMVLEASYEATFHAGLINYQNTGNPLIYLTLVGGGAFGNDKKWIFDALRFSLLKFKSEPLDIRIVSHSNSNFELQQFIQSLNL